MKQATYIILVAFTVLFAVLSATAHGFKGNMGPFGNIDMRMTMIQSMLDLNDEQTKDVENIFRANMQEAKAIIKSHGLTRGDIKVMRMMQNKFRQQTMENLAVILDQEQLMTIRQEVFSNSPFAFIALDAIETPGLLLESLGISEEEASQVLSILEEMENKREIVLENLGFDHEKMASFRYDMKNKRNEMQEDLGMVLNNEQLEQLQEFRSRMSQKRQSQLDHFTQKGM